MTKKIFTLFMGLIMCFALSAQNNNHRPHMKMEDFNKNRELFIAKQAKLTTEETLCFFPIYNECQKKKQELNGRIWFLRKSTFKKKLNETEYEKILRDIVDLLIQVETLDKEYLPRYHKVLSYEKIFAVYEAESRFQREILNKMRSGGMATSPNMPKTK